MIWLYGLQLLMWHSADAHPLLLVVAAFVLAGSCFGPRPLALIGALLSSFVITPLGPLNLLAHDPFLSMMYLLPVSWPALALATLVPRYPLDPLWRRRLVIVQLLLAYFNTVAQHQTWAKLGSVGLFYLGLMQFKNGLLARYANTSALAMVLSMLALSYTNAEGCGAGPWVDGAMLGFVTIPLLLLRQVRKPVHPQAP